MTLFLHVCQINLMFFLQNVLQPKQMVPVQQRTNLNFMSYSGEQNDRMKPLSQCSSSSYNTCNSEWDKVSMKS